MHPEPARQHKTGQVSENLSGLSFFDMSLPPDPDPPLAERSPPHHGLKRHKRSRSNRSAAHSWVNRNRLPLSMIGCLVGGFLFLLNPWVVFIPSTEPGDSTWVNVQTWLASNGGSQVIGGLLLLASFPLSILFMRRTVLYNDRFWRRNGCPHCGRDELRRTGRLWYHRLLNLLGLPVRRFVCPNCHWKGGRIDEGHL